MEKGVLADRQVHCQEESGMIRYGTNTAVDRSSGELMLGITAMAKDDVGADAKESTKVEQQSVKVRLTLNKSTARKLGRVSRWEKSSEGTSLELTGRR
jgi:hypothetical protein